MLKIILVILIGYFLGNISSSYYLGKILGKKDIREHGSGNAGTTNALRVFGAKIAVITLIFDILKGAIAILIGSYILGDTGAIIGGLCAVIGHDWPVLLGFKGGKGIATTIAVVIAIEPIVAIICIIIGVLLIIKTKYVSLGSVVGMSLLPIVSIVVLRPFDLRFFMFALALSVIAIYKHRGNISRLLKGKESKLGHKA